MHVVYQFVFKDLTSRYCVNLNISSHKCLAQELSHFDKTYFWLCNKSTSLHLISIQKVMFNL